MKALGMRAGAESTQPLGWPRASTYHRTGDRPTITIWSLGCRPPFRAH